jgi:hypothetical protein
MRPMLVVLSIFTVFMLAYGQASVIFSYGDDTHQLRCPCLNGQPIASGQGTVCLTHGDTLLGSWSFSAIAPGTFVSPPFTLRGQLSGYALHTEDALCYWRCDLSPVHIVPGPQRVDVTGLLWTCADSQESVADRPYLPETLSLQAYPNPFNSSVRLRLEAQPIERKILLYDLLGREIDVLTVMPFATELIWSPLQLPTGIYFARLGHHTVKLAYLR